MRPRFAVDCCLNAIRPQVEVEGIVGEHPVRRFKCVRLDEASAVQNTLMVCGVSPLHAAIPSRGVSSWNAPLSFIVQFNAEDVQGMI